MGIDTEYHQEWFGDPGKIALHTFDGMAFASSSSTKLDTLTRARGRNYCFS
jgi:hypothetical protein